ncbi:hypothetical protein HOLleu_04951 [Holothuria leucospilota]|uniref:Integrase catalytic domain-containing protein n=1 Tax=Holothuria leucospilota TaxID=206669 RepID=A0A9Q1HE76_HOLLE|nr:hypothetical protein HOLleu_04951 [Holothuria leucospilota]
MPKFPEMNWTAGDVAEEFQLFKQRLELCFIDHNIAEPNKRAVKIKIAVGNEGLKKINASGLSVEDQNDPVKLWSLFEDQLKVKVNFRIHRLELIRYKEGKQESLDDFINRCRQKAAECDFNQNEIAERIIELVIASTPFVTFQKDLLDTPKGYTIEDVLKEGFTYEAVVASPAIVGLPTCDNLNLVTIHAATTSLAQQGATSDNVPTIRSIQDLTTRYPDQFDTIGNFKMEATLHLKEDAQPSIDPPLEYSIHIKDKLKAELNKMEDQGVIRKVTNHTDWCNSLSVVFKKDDTPQICLDPRRFNDNLKRCPHKTPTLEELNPAFSSAKYFSKLDAKAGYCKEDESIQVRMDLINFGTNKQEVLRRETERDPTLRALIQVINEGWPDTIKELPQDLRPYWSFREQLGISDGVIFKGRQVIIPKPLQSDILSQLHTGHLGIEKTRRLSRESVYWQHINKDIDQLIKSCDICQTSQPQQENEPLIPHEIPSTPWTKIATDLYQIGKDDYLLITDYHSKYPVVYKLPNTSSFTVAKLTAETFSLFGSLKEIISDNGPQFTGQPYKDMCYKWVITHNPSSPRYPKSNGLVERMVRTVKNLIKKSQKSN